MYLKSDSLCIIIIIIIMDHYEKKPLFSYLIRLVKHGQWREAYSHLEQLRQDGYTASARMVDMLLKTAGSKPEVEQALQLAQEVRLNHIKTGWSEIRTHGTFVRP